MDGESPRFPLQPTVVDVGPVDGEAVAEGTLQTLQDVARDHVLFTPAILFTHARLDRDPLVDFAHFNSLTRDEAPFAIDCPYPIFQDLGHSIVQGKLIEWDRRIYAVAAHRWEQLRGFISSIALVERRAGFYAKIGYYQLKIVDPTILHSGRVLTELPTVEICVFMVSSNRGLHYISWAADPPRTRAYPKTDPTDPAVLVEAQAVLGPPMDLTSFAQKENP